MIPSLFNLASLRYKQVRCRAKREWNAGMPEKAANFGCRNLCFYCVFEQPTNMGDSGSFRRRSRGGLARRAGIGVADMFLLRVHMIPSLFNLASLRYKQEFSSAGVIINFNRAIVIGRVELLWFTMSVTSSPPPLRR